MPVTALAPENTARWRLVYQVGGIEHGVVMRVDATNPTQTTVEAGFSQLLSDLSAQMWEITFVRLEYAAAGSTIFNPQTSALSGVLAGAGAGGPEQNVRSISFVGRTGGGHKARVFLYGYGAATADNMRVTTVERAEVAAAIARINGYLHLFVAIDAIKPTYNGYVNINYNKHWTKVIRQT